MKTKKVILGVVLGAALTAVAYETGLVAKGKDGVKAGVNRVKKLIKRNPGCECSEDLEDIIEDTLD